MPLRFMGAGTNAVSGSATTLTPASTTAINNLSTGIRLAVCAVKNNAEITTATPGWVKLNQVNSGAGLTMAVFIAAITAAAPVFTWAGAAACSAIQLIYDDPTDPVVSASIGASSTNSGSASPFVATGVTTTQAKSLAVAIHALASTATFGGAPSGWVVDGNAANGSPNMRLLSYSKSMDAAGATGDASTTMGSPPAWASMMVELQITLPTDEETGELELVPVTTPQSVTATEFELVPILASARAEVVELELVPIFAAASGPDLLDAVGTGSLAFLGDANAMIVADAAGAGGVVLDSNATTMLVQDSAGIASITFSGSAAAEGIEGDTLAAGLTASPALAFDLTIATPIAAAMLVEPRAPSARTRSRNIAGMATCCSPRRRWKRRS